MPFGIKIRASDGRPHDFDKIYRVIIKRAVERAGMTCIRADETKGSRMIHTDMFRDLRDQVLVIADLSLHNPNVFYEVGMRHVMSGTGTVLMCENQSLPLPFDIGLSRAVTYDYDGANLDWEEAERLVDQLHAALIESGPGAPDSPVHALLERVLSDNTGGASGGTTSMVHGPSASLFDLGTYIDLVASKWREDGKDFETIFEAHRGSIFGASALGRYVLGDDKLLAEWAPKVASQLSDLAVWDLCSQIYQKLDKKGLASYQDLARYASAHSECNPDITGANQALEIAYRALEALEAHYNGDLESDDAIHALSYCKRRIAGLTQWRWELSRKPEDLESAIKEQSDCITLIRRSLNLNSTQARLTAEALANSLLKRMLLLRIQSGDRKLADPERDLSSILELQISESSDRLAASYLRWYRTIALADSGAADRVRQSALEAFSKDSDLMHLGPEFAEVGRRQYTGLRRLMDNYASWFRHPELMGVIGQTLQARRS